MFPREFKLLLLLLSKRRGWISMKVRFDKKAIQATEIKTTKQ